MSTLLSENVIIAKNKKQYREKKYTKSYMAAEIPIAFHYQRLQFMGVNKYYPLRRKGWKTIKQKGESS